jgi:Zn-dependent peptidase ImmA (M78 family)
MTEDKKPDYTNARNKALEILRERDYMTPYINPIDICRDFGIDVFFADFEGDYNKISGFFDGKKNSIFVNQKEILSRKTFTIAHELGHSVLHKDWIATSDYQVLFRDPSRATKDWREKEADTFAANLLVPKFMLDKYYKIATIEELARLFLVSVPVMQNRIRFEYGNKKN